MLIANSQALFAINGGKRVRFQAKVPRLSFQANLSRFSSLRVRASSLPTVFHKEDPMEDEIIRLCLKRSDFPGCHYDAFTRSRMMSAVLDDQVSSAEQGLFLNGEFPLVTKVLVPDADLYSHIPETVTAAHFSLFTAYNMFIIGLITIPGGWTPYDDIVAAADLHLLKIPETVTAAHFSLFTAYNMFIIGLITIPGGWTPYDDSVAEADLHLLKALSKAVLSGTAIADEEYAESPKKYQAYIDSDDFQKLLSITGGKDDISALALESRVRTKFQSCKAYVGKELIIEDVFRYFVLPVKKNVFAQHMLLKKN